MEPKDRSREAPGASPVDRSPALGALRAALTLLVVAHHAALAYISWAPPAATTLVAEPRLWMAFPIVDTARARGLDLFVGWNDTFFMSLLFLVAGAVAWPSLVRRGPSVYLRERFRRLGGPFLLSAALLAPLAYLPTWLAARRSTGAGAGSFASQWLQLGEWPAGPAWFLWVLLAFGALAALARSIAPGWGTAVGRLASRLSRRPALFAITLVLVSAAVYLPAAAHFQPETWLDLGPFWIQISRALHYAVYFVAGIGIGASGLANGLLEPTGRLARRWPLWAIAATLAYALAIAILVTILGTLAHGGPGPILLAAGNFAFVLCCAMSSLAMLGFFVRRFRATGPWLDSLIASAFGIYLLHYAAVSWLQLALLPVGIPGIVKAFLVFAVAVVASWSVTALLRRLPPLRRYL